MREPITFIIASRNDNYCGNSLGRLLNVIDALWGECDCEDEIILIDWGSKEPLHGCYTENVRHLFVPPSITEQYKTPFHETLALNIGIRRARNKYIGRLDQDTIPGLRFFDWLDTRPKPDHNIYFSLRRDIPSGSSFHCFGDATEENDFPIWRNWNVNYPEYFRGAVGILLAPATIWRRVRGYDESLLYRNHMEHDLILRMKQEAPLVNLGLLTNHDFYHQFHYEPTGRKDNPPRDLKDIDPTILPNDDNWGLFDHDFEVQSA